MVAPEFKPKSVFRAGPIMLHYNSDMDRGQKESIIIIDFLISQVTWPSNCGY